MELTTAQAIKAITLALNTEEVETIILNGEELRVTAFAEVFTATEETVYRLIGIDSTEEEAVFIAIDELPYSHMSGKIFRDKVFTYPIRDSFSEALCDYSILQAEKVETHTSYMEAMLV